MKLNTIIYSTHQTIDVNSAVKSAWYLYYRISYYRNIDKKHLWADIYLLCDLLEKMATQDCRSYHTLNSIIKLLSRLNTLSYFSVMLASQVEKRIKSLKVLIEEDKYFLNKTRHFDPWLTAESLAIAYLTFKNTDYQRFLDQVLKKNRQDFDADYVQNCPPSNWQLSYWIYLYKLTPRDQKGLHLESKRADFLRDSIKKNIVYKSTYTTCGPELICNQIYFLLSLVLTMRENKNEATTSIVDYLGLHYYVY
ncbi:hypothetical protein [Mucilaginibacter sp.]|uniref:hypothetical protein n=1 Tax=Mucilaginibacter sp. TaxID=1882438 RepID=UPI003266A465